jgi:creatinine amidohydrolase
MLPGWLANITLPADQKSMIDLARLSTLNPVELRAYLQDGNFGGYYQRPDDEMLALWQVAVEETRALLAEGWD